ncbi:unnamed protein product [Prorocentrum cordatum]|uniref:Uncharacterized protein n=1 Tax=Prorocentrum cordatum TaxID=2364126 RepID=A0ABN9T8L7_9DINO|nr:unnamed protein product [Polarella glacialis]
MAAPIGAAPLSREPPVGPGAAEAAVVASAVALPCSCWSSWRSCRGWRGATCSRSGILGPLAEAAGSLAGGCRPCSRPLALATPRPVRVAAAVGEEWEVTQRFGQSGVQQTYVLNEENAEIVLQECREALRQCFGYDKENRDVGITGKVNFVSLEGPFMTIAFDEGNFWHKRSDLLKRVEVCVIDRIPELAGVEIEDESMLVDARRGGSESSNVQDNPMR